MLWDGGSGTWTPRARQKSTVSCLRTEGWFGDVGVRGSCADVGKMESISTAARSVKTAHTVLLVGAHARAHPRRGHISQPQAGEHTHPNTANPQKNENVEFVRAMINTFAVVGASCNTGRREDGSRGAGEGTHPRLSPIFWNGMEWNF